jgi:hypothetical protein
MTVVDQLNVAGDERNSGLWARALHRGDVHICWEIDVPAWKALLRRSLS